MGRGKDLGSRPDISLALGKVESDKIEFRLNGLLELRRIINDNRQSTRIKQIDDKGYHAILETVFRVAKIDISGLARATKYTTVKISSRLSACGSLVRTIVDVGLTKLRHKTVKALVEHISQSLPTADASYCEPLVVDYFKALAILLEYTAHVEHLSADDWHELLDFCMETARDLNRSVESNGANASNLPSGDSSRGRHIVAPNTPLDTVQSFSSHDSQRLLYPQLQGSNEDVLLCIRHLVIVPNAPVAGKAEMILTVVLDLLGTYPHLSKIQQVLYEILDSILSKIVISDMSLSLRTVSAMIPLVRKSWQRATINQRELMLSLLLRGQSLLPQLIRSDSKDVTLNLGALLEVVKGQYCARKPREQLQMEDLDFSKPNTSSHKRPPLSIKAMSLRLGKTKSEEPWCVIHVSASIYVVLEQILADKSLPEEDEFRINAKRQKRSSPVDELLQYMREPHIPSKLYALQVIAFAYELHGFEPRLLQDTAESIMSHISNDDSHVVSWAILAVASLAAQSTQIVHITAFWTRVWRQIFRHMTSSITCGVACQALAIILENRLVDYSDVADLVDSMLISTELNGPSVCDGASTRLWIVLLWQRRRENLITDAEMSSTILRWLYRCWSPGRLHDRSHTSYIAHNFSIPESFNLICLCLGLSTPRPARSSLLCLGRLSQTRLVIMRDLELSQYLLQEYPRQNQEDIKPLLADELGDHRISMGTGYRALSNALMEFLVQEISSICSVVLAGSSVISSNFNTEIIHLFLQLGVIGFGLLSCPLIQGVPHNFIELLDRLRTGLKQTMSKHEKRKDFLITYVDAMGSILDHLSMKSADPDPLAQGIIAMAQGLDQRFWETARVDPSAVNGPEDELDDMDVDVNFGSQTGQRQGADTSSTAVHDEIEATTSVDAFRASVIAKVCYASSLNDSFSDEQFPAKNSCSIFVEYLTSLQGHDFLLSGTMLRELLASNAPLLEDDADTLLQYIQQVVVKPYKLERSEVSIGLCIDTLAALAHMWTMSDSGDIAATGAELYIWFVNIVLGSGIAAPSVLSSAANLLQQIIRVCPDYAKDLSLTSARTTLLQVLRDGNLLVKYNIGNNIPNIFGLFVLKEHASILEDIIDSLPSDPTWIEGIALRIHILSKMAATWPTLLRRCTYAIFETAGHVKGSAGYARLGLHFVSNKLKLLDSKELFKLFAPQLLYTWVETQLLGSVPFKAFDYPDLKSLLLDIQDEAVGQIVMRGKSEEMAQIAADLQISFEELVVTSFSKCAAYSIARDIAIPPSDNSQAPQAEARLRKLLGKEKYATLVTQHFAEIVALFFNTTDYEDQIQKAFQKTPTYSHSNSAYQEIVSISTSDKALPPNQQPSFKAKYLLAELEHLCNRTSYDVESLWTATLYVYIFRTMINTTHSALGSLHICSVLRKIRILICMAGPVALEAYPLEMALHTLRPFLIDAQCTDDAVGLVQYLLQNGMPYLKEAPKVLLGHAVMTLISMKPFLSSSQDSTTQESHFRTTISHAKSYHDWLVSYLMSYKSPHLSTEATVSFQAMAKAAGNLRHGGSARKGTHESDLLLAFLEDICSGRHLLSQASQNFLLRSLSASFEVPQRYHDDILGDDKQAVRYASTVFSTCHWKSAGPRYLMWSGRVLGRAYASQGLIDTSIVHETSVRSTSADLSRPAIVTLSISRMRLLHLISDLLMRDHSQEVGLAEMALNYIVTESHLTKYALECERCLEPSIYRASLCLEYSFPAFTTHARGSPKPAHLDEILTPTKDQTAEQWINALTENLTLVATEDPLMIGLSRILGEIKGLAEESFPFVLHLVLLRENGHKGDVKLRFSELCRQLFERCGKDANEDILRPLLNAILYLRTQPLPNESSRTDRARWLDLDFGQAARAANQCLMYKTALMFLEIEESERAKAEVVSRRRSKGKQDSIDPPNDLLLDIYQHIDEQDAFYGVRQPSSLLSMMSRLEYEHAGFKSLSFRGAFYDGQIRRSDNAAAIDQEGMVRALNDMDLNGLSQPLVNKMIGSGPRSIDAALSTARKLEQWDVSPPSSYNSNASTIYEVFRKINNASENENITTALNIGFADTVHRLLADEPTRSSPLSTLRSLAVLTEVEEVFSSRRITQLEEVFTRFQVRDNSLHSQSYDHIKDIVSCRETTFSCLSKQPRLQEMLKTSLREALLLECRMLLASSSISRSHGALQNSLSTTTYLNQLVEPCKSAGINITAAAQFESSHVLWSQGETTASVRLLRDLNHNLRMDLLEPQSFPIGKAELLAKLGHHTAEARLQKPETIIQTMLKMAVKELNGETAGDAAGEVFHEFASFCDQQLQNPDSLADFKRIQRLRERKEAEVRDLDRMIKSAGSQTKEKENLKSHRNKAHQWFKLDDGEFQRLDINRLTLVKYSLENYLLCLKASDKFDNDALRFSALWLENNENMTANEAVARYMPQVPSRKFAPLMNQWTSRLLDVPGQFQSLLSAIIQRICVDHPYHGMYQIFASSKTKGGKDETALARHAAANTIVERLRASTLAQKTWINVHNTNVTFVRFAQERLDDSSIKPGSKVLLRKSDSGRRVEQDVLKMRVPPPTMSIDLRADCNYDNVTVIAKFQPEYTVAGGISMPKIVTALGTDGIKYKQLFKGGNDDLRQDAIMEQVFGAVSSLLKAQRATRQRDLKIRTYKVLPLTATSGVIEFVSNTIPLHDYLLPAHQRHYPKDLKPNACRKHIQDAQSTSADNRIKVFRKVCEQFHPVLRYFFQERFESPDDWFDKRLAYTRSTAAISILGHILGLGDRHGHNILLDEKTGEVVHIDLGIAFEQGRVLPVPEVVPFRLTRDLVDGMGITGTEGVFRRCCEFTLEALRNESYSIMTILDVLRYDPLYSWSLSPLRLKKMQDAQTEDPALPADGGEGAGKKVEEDAGEAERALLVVGKKLSRTLSVQATVNELIQQATDERNLAVLFCGWAAYA